MRFRDRIDAGRQLASRLAPYRAERPIVLGLPRGGMVVADEVARALDAPLDAWIVRKIGCPGQPELGLGAVAEGDVIWLDPDMIEGVGARSDQVERVVRAESEQVHERVRRFRGDRTPPDVEGRTVIVVDDGIATGGTVRAALRALRQRGPRRIVLAVPIAAAQSLEVLEREADAVECVHAPRDLRAIGMWYDDFAQVEDDEVRRILDAAHRRAGAQGAPAPRRDATLEMAVMVACDGMRLPGDLVVPSRARGLVLFAHGSGSSRKSPRNRQVALALQEVGLATLLFDLLTPEEDRDRAARFDIPRLADRVVAATRWLQGQPEVAGLRIGYFGASTGAAAALVAAADLGDVVGAVVSRGGRPDLAGNALPRVACPTLLVVGGEDDVVLELNRQAQRLMTAECHLAVVPGATHLFDEPGTLEEVQKLAAGWLREHLAARVPGTAGARRGP